MKAGQHTAEGATQTPSASPGIRQISCDIESFASIDLSKAGVFKYAESQDFEVLLFGYSVNSGDVQVVDFTAGEQLPPEVFAALIDDSVIKWAFNAQFERICLSKWLGLPAGEYLNPESWRCTMVWSAYMGLPLSLEGVGAVLGLEKQKLTEGKDLIRYFCKPCNPTAANDGRTRNLPIHAPDKWAAFKAYNRRDVEAEMAIQEKLSRFPVPDSVWAEYHLDQEINDRGVALDMTLVKSAIEMDRCSRNELSTAMIRLTDLENPNSVAQMKQWLSDNGLETDSLGKKAVAEMLKTAPGELHDVLALRQQLAKSSVKKYQAMENAVCADGRARGMFQFYGASRTGRFSSKIVQLQNLPGNHLESLEQARGLVSCGDFEAVKMLYEDIPDTLSQLIRTAFVPRPGCKFVVADFSAIEARLIAWLAGEKWRQDVFAKGGDIYCASASQMFKVPVEKHGINGHLRQKGKISELALGYGGSVGALKAMGALEMGLSEEELTPLVAAWRQANPRIVKFWWDVDRSAMKAVRDKTTTETHGITFSCQSGMLFITLPSGRWLAYVKPRIGENRFGSQCITYEGVGATKKWERLETYGPKLVENCLAEGTFVLTNRGLICIQDIHDNDLIWDGVEWVRHGGLIDNGMQPTVSIGASLHMTRNHKILTEKGWICCNAATGLNWKEVQPPNGNRKSRKHNRRESSMAMPLRLRGNESNTISTFAVQKVSSEVMWVYDESTDKRSKQGSRYEPSSSIRCVALNETTLPGQKSLCLSQLWRARHYRLSGVGSQFRSILGRHGWYISAWAGLGPYRQQQRLLQGELQMDHKKKQQQEQTNKPHHRNPIWNNDGLDAVGADWHRSNDTFIQTRTRLANRIVVRETGLKERVYDIRNCGSRHRFAIFDRAAGKLRIVSNCTQAIARDVLCYAMQTLQNCSIVMHIHDEIVIEADQRMSLDAVCEQMSRTPPWAKGLLLRADGYKTDFYKKD